MSALKFPSLDSQLARHQTPTTCVSHHLSKFHSIFLSVLVITKTWRSGLILSKLLSEESIEGFFPHAQWQMRAAVSLKHKERERTDTMRTKSCWVPHQSKKLGIST